MTCSGIVIYNTCQRAPAMDPQHSEAGRPRNHPRPEGCTRRVCCCLTLTCGCRATDLAFNCLPEGYVAQKAHACGAYSAKGTA